MTRPIFILNGPNLNLLGTREPEVYGSETLADIEARCRERASEIGIDIDFRQSNSEAELVDWIQAALTGAAGVILNAGAYTHTSIAILDALKVLDVPIVELHLSNVFRREPFRHRSFVSPAADGIICGFGAFGYVMAIEAMAERIDSKGTG